MTSEAKRAAKQCIALAFRCAQIVLALVCTVTPSIANTSDTVLIKIGILSSGSVTDDARIVKVLGGLINHRLKSLNRRADLIVLAGGDLDTDLNLTIAKLGSIKFDVIIANGLPLALAAYREFPLVPIIFFTSQDTQQIPWLQSTSVERDRITGYANYLPLEEKLLELVHMCVAKPRKIALIEVRDAREPWWHTEKLRAAIESAGIGFQRVEFSRDWRSYDLAQSMKKLRPDIAIFGESVTGREDSIIKGLEGVRTFGIGSTPQFAKVVGALSLESNARSALSSIARLAVGVLTGIKPRDLPIEKPTSTTIYVQLEALQSFGPPCVKSVLRRADYIF